MKPREDQPGVVTENEQERRFVYDMAARYTTRIVRKIHTQSLHSATEPAILEGAVVFLPRTNNAEMLALDVPQTEFVLKGIREEIRMEDSSFPALADRYEQTAELIGDALLRSLP